MEYTRSDAFVTHSGTGQRMHQGSEPVTTEVSPQDMNMVIWNLMEIVKAAGVTAETFDPDDADTYTVLKRSLDGVYGGLVDTSDFYQATTATGAFAELGLSRKKLVNVADFPWLCDMTGATDCSLNFHLAKAYATSIGALPYVGPGILQASIDFRNNKAGVVGAGASVSEVRVPTWSVSITSITTAANVLTVLCDSTTKLWVGRSIRIRSTTESSHNSGFEVTAIDSPTQFKCRQLNATVTGNSTGGAFMAGGVINAGELCNGNSAGTYSGLLIRDITVNGMRGVRPMPDQDLTDWGIALTAFSDFMIHNVVAKDCWQGGIGIFINSNYGSVHGCRVENSGYSAQSPAGLDINSSKHLQLSVISKNCKYGARILDNCWNITGQIVIDNAEVIGLVGSNQSVNESHNIRLDVTVEGGCTSDGVQIGRNFRNANIVCSVNGVTGSGVREVYSATAGQRPTGNIITATTRQCGLAGAVLGGNGSNWRIASYMDGRSGAAGSSFAVVVEGAGNTFTASIVDSGTPQVRGIHLTATSGENHLVGFHRSGLVSNYLDEGTLNRFQAPHYRGQASYDTPNLAAGAQVYVAVSVPGARMGRGDIAEARFSANLGGVSIYSEVVADDQAGVWITNVTASATDLGPGTLSVAVLPGAP